MYTFDTKIRVHYALTDQMGVVYHGHFAQFYEIGRTESIRALGFTYKDMEALGIMMPVVDIQMKFFQPAKYDDLITVKTILKEIPHSHKVVFYGEIYNEQNILLSSGNVTLYFMEMNGRKRSEMPADLKLKIASFF